MGFLFQAPRNQDPTFPFRKRLPLALGSLEELDPVAEGILHIEATKSRNLAILIRGQTGSDQPLPQGLEVIGQ